MGITNKEMVSATQKVKMDDLVATAPVVSVEDALQGQLGGVDIVLGGDDPGTRSAIRIPWYQYFECFIRSIDCH